MRVAIKWFLFRSRGLVVGFGRSFLGFKRNAGIGVDAVPLDLILTQSYHNNQEYFVNIL